MTTSPVFLEYVSVLDILLTPPIVDVRGRPVARPAEPFDEAQLAAAELALPISQDVQTLFEEQWRSASTDLERSVAEVRLLGAAAADLAIAERLAHSALGDADDAPSIWRSSVTVGQEALIKRAIEEPEKLLAAERLISYRVGESQELLAATYECLRFVRYETIETCGDAFSSMLSVDFSLFKQAAALVDVKIAKHIDKLATGLMKIAVDYVLAAIDKIDTLLGPEVVGRVKEAVLDFIIELQENELVGRAVDKFLNTDAIYEESKGWIQAYDGSKKTLKSTAETIGALQGSFRGRVRIADIVIKGLSVARLLSPLAALPWGPLGMASAYLSVVGYVLYSAHDHVDSDKYTFFDRVQGVRGTLLAELLENREIGRPVDRETSRPGDGETGRRGDQ